ncbi:DUF1990 family protein [Homoserinibacter sp. YIM 151385]|uniref:DUF1990 family protein n=1 Tax=Homoserinibacter sp. YIM 151385 TaxID=2985506 RepID=UPI0022F1035C|nr:DUF1990 domain-containing protein [Homoserinibacter sp. YIM 151385]WBU38937.1 DUF1990 domain-containing protein [Homoserinibacter sp. YIM 151385]
MTRPPLWEQSVTYGAVGATRAADLLEYPPAGYRPLERRVRIGHGEDRWRHAWSQTLSWGIQRRSGFRVRVDEAPAEVSEATYIPVGYDEAGQPVAPAAVEGAGEAAFGPEGESLIRPGDSARLGIPVWPIRFDFPARVVYVVDEPDRKGFAYGTLPGHAEEGEEAFLVSRGGDGSVWVTIRAFSRPAGWWWLLAPALRIAQAYYTSRYLRALMGPIPGQAAEGGGRREVTA